MVCVEQVKHVFPFSICLRGYVPHGADFLKFCKFGTMQYIVLKPLMTLAAIIMSVRPATLAHALPLRSLHR